MSDQPDTLPTPLAPSPRDRFVGEQKVWNGRFARALLQRGVPQRDIAKCCHLSLSSVSAISTQGISGDDLLSDILAEFDKVERALKRHGELTALLKAHEAQEMDSPSRVSAWLTNAEKWQKLCGSPEQANIPTYQFIQNNFGIQPSHSSSQRTIEGEQTPATPQPVVSGPVQAEADEASARNQDGGT